MGTQTYGFAFELAPSDTAWDHSPPHNYWLAATFRKREDHFQ